jgi:hypothetical protein
LRAKLTPDLPFNVRPIQERMSRFVRIEKCCDRQNLAQTFDERAFTRGNSAGDPNCRHDLVTWNLVTPQLCAA